MPKLFFFFFFQSDALNVKLLQREIEMYLDGSKHKRWETLCIHVAACYVKIIPRAFNSPLRREALSWL